MLIKSKLPGSQFKCTEKRQGPAVAQSPQLKLQRKPRYLQIKQEEAWRSLRLIFLSRFVKDVYVRSLVPDNTTIEIASVVVVVVLTSQ